MIFITLIKNYLYYTWVIFSQKNPKSSFKNGQKCFFLKLFYNKKVYNGVYSSFFIQ